MGGYRPIAHPLPRPYGTLAPIPGLEAEPSPMSTEPHRTARAESPVYTIELTFEDPIPYPNRAHGTLQLRAIVFRLRTNVLHRVPALILVAVQEFLFGDGQPESYEHDEETHDHPQCVSHTITMPFTVTVS